MQIPQSLSKQGLGAGAFLRQVRDELQQVTWPTKQQTIRLTIIVVGVTVIVGAYLGALDYIFTQIMGRII